MADTRPTREVYLDYAATTPVDPRAVEAMTRCLRETYGNPSSLHFIGQRAEGLLSEARRTFAAGLGARPEELVFTSGGSEANALALLGVSSACGLEGSHIITSSVEHHSVLRVCEHLESARFRITYLPVDEYGLVHCEDLERALTADTILVSIMHANNEIGAIQPIAKLSALARARGALFHTDAVQTVGHMAVDVAALDVDLLGLSAHKFGGPKGVGALYVREGVPLKPLLRGGAQERGRRAGTENVPGIVGAAAALEAALATRETEESRVRGLRDHLWERLCSSVPGIRLNGHPVCRLANNLNISFRGIEGEGLLLLLSRAGVAASIGSACNAESLEPSHVIRAVGVPREWERGAIRMSPGRLTTREEIDYAADVLIRIVNEMGEAVTGLCETEGCATDGR